MKSRMAENVVLTKYRSLSDSGVNNLCAPRTIEAQDDTDYDSDEETTASGWLSCFCCCFRGSRGRGGSSKGKAVNPAASGEAVDSGTPSLANSPPLLAEKEKNKAAGDDPAPYLAQNTRGETTHAASAGSAASREAVASGTPSLTSSQPRLAHNTESQIAGSGDAGANVPLERVHQADETACHSVPRQQPHRPSLFENTDVVFEAHALYNKGQKPHGVAQQVWEGETLPAETKGYTGRYERPSSDFEHFQVIYEVQTQYRKAEKASKEVQQVCKDQPVPENFPKADEVDHSAWEHITLIYELQTQYKQASKTSEETQLSKDFETIFKDAHAIEAMVQSLWQEAHVVSEEIYPLCQDVQATWEEVKLLWDAVEPAWQHVRAVGKTLMGGKIVDEEARRTWEEIKPICEEIKLIIKEIQLIWQEAQPIFEEVQPACEEVMCLWENVKETHREAVEILKGANI